jgi:hypothetical protein
VNVSGIVKLDATPGRVTSIELTTGHVCSPSEGTSLDCAIKPAEATLPGDSVKVVGVIAKTGP